MPYKVLDEPYANTYHPTAKKEYPPKGALSRDRCRSRSRYGEEHYLIPVETGVEVGEGQVAIESGRSEKVLGGIGFVVNRILWEIRTRRGKCYGE